VVDADQDHVVFGHGHLHPDPWPYALTVGPTVQQRARRRKDARGRAPRPKARDGVAKVQLPTSPLGKRVDSCTLAGEMSGGNPAAMIRSPPAPGAAKSS